MTRRRPLRTHRNRPEPPLGRTARTRLRVRYADTDRMGVVYYANYLVWFEVGRCEWLRSFGWSYRELEERDAIMLPVIEAHCEYRRPARYDDELEVKTWGRLLSPARIEFHYQVSRQADAAVTARGRTVHAAVGTNGRPRRLPAHIQELFR